MMTMNFFSDRSSDNNSNNNNHNANRKGGIHNESNDNASHENNASRGKSESENKNKNGSENTNANAKEDSYEKVKYKDKGSSIPWIIAISIASGLGYYYYVTKYSKEGSSNDDNNKSLVEKSKDAAGAVTGLIKSFQEPAFDKLLPDQVIDPQHPRPYTLVIDLDKFLVCHLWDPDQGRWRIAKRPGAELFLFYAAQLYEVVVFSSLQQFDGDAIVKKLDPFGCISYALYRFATKHEKGKYYKVIFFIFTALIASIIHYLSFYFRILTS